MDIGWRDAVIVLKHAFDEDDRGCAILRRADALALEIPARRV